MLIELAGPTNDYYSLKISSIDKYFDAGGKKFDALKADLRDDINVSTNKFTEAKEEVGGKCRRVPQS